MLYDGAMHFEEEKEDELGKVRYSKECRTFPSSSSVYS